MKITKELLEELGACLEARECFDKHKEFHTDGVAALQLLMTDKWRNIIGEEFYENSLEWANWLITNLLTSKQCVEYAIFAAEQVLDIFEKIHPCDSRPREAIEVAKAYLTNPCKETRDAAWSAAWAARESAWDAWSAASAAWAAREAASAAWAARAAREAASAAREAANDYDKVLVTILEFGITLLER